MGKFGSDMIKGKIFKTFEFLFRLAFTKLKKTFPPVSGLTKNCFADFRITVKNCGFLATPEKQL